MIFSLNKIFCFMILSRKENTMKNLILVFLVIGTGLIFFSCQEDSALAPVADQSDQVPGSLELDKKPSPNLTGTMDLDFDLFAVLPDDPVWVGKITFQGYGEFDGVYGLRFFHLSPFKDYSQASPFEEYFEIYDLANEEVVYLGGPDEGVTTLANKPPEPSKYRMNGKIDVANESFEMWLGRHVHMSGVITWQNLGTPEEPAYAPATAPGTFRIN
jgi:hypothetical protein